MTTNSTGLVQKQLVTAIRYTMAGGVITVTKQVGPGALTRSGAGVLLVTYAPGANGLGFKGIDPLRQVVEAYATGTVDASMIYDSAAATDTVIPIDVFDAAGMALDNQPGIILISQILGD